MGILAFRTNTPFLVRCDYCGKSVKQVYHISIDGIQYKFCGGAHANLAANNYKLNKERGVTPTLETPDDTTTEE